MSKYVLLFGDLAGRCKLHLLDQDCIMNGGYLPESVVRSNFYDCPSYISALHDH